MNILYLPGFVNGKYILNLSSNNKYITLGKRFQKLVKKASTSRFICVVVEHQHHL